MLFPSPCGDELNYEQEILALAEEPFPSPCGDELNYDLLQRHLSGYGFRPLAGMS